MPDKLRFLASKRSATPSALLLGVPLDLTESFRSGSRFAPSHIREGSDSIESYSPVLRADLEDIDLVDLGDLSFDGRDMACCLSDIEAAVLKSSDQAPVLLLGGEHTVTLGAVIAFANRYPELQVLQIDAHLDLIDSYQGHQVSHATVFRRVADIIGFDSLAQVGVRSGTRDEFALAGRCLYSSHELLLPSTVRSKLQGPPIYLSIDIDVLDPAFAPGTGNPEPGGCTYNELMTLVYSLAGLNVVGMDVVEVSPPLDPSGITSIAAAKLVRELVLLFGRRG